MNVFVDTSACFALLDRLDDNNKVAKRIWTSLLNEATPLVVSNYVLLETTVLVQRRLGFAAVAEYYDAVFPLLRVIWIDEQMHNAGMSTLLSTGRRPLSLVDCTSFLICRDAEIDTVFAFDRHFTEQGFRTLA